MPEWVVFVTIGRNVGMEPMSRQKWRSFRQATRLVLDATVGSPDFEIVGFGGRWGGVAEMAAVFVVLGTVTRLDLLMERLKELAASYGQEAIALAIGGSELISPTADST
jgi:hypothetical protein